VPLAATLVAAVLVLDGEPSIFSGGLLLLLVCAVLALAATAASAIELTPDNFEAETAGKQVFIKFLAPW